MGLATVGEISRRRNEITFRFRSFVGVDAGSKRLARLLETGEPAVRENIAGAIRSPTRRIHFTVRADLHFAATLLEILDEFFAGIELGAGGLVTVKIADQADTESHVIHVIAVN